MIQRVCTMGQICPPLLICVNKVLLARGHVYSFTYQLRLFLQWQQLSRVAVTDLTYPATPNARAGVLGGGAASWAPPPSPPHSGCRPTDLSPRRQVSGASQRGRTQLLSARLDCPLKGNNYLEKM